MAKEPESDGYMRALHRVQEKLYEKNCPLPLTTKVLLFIQHETLRWENEAAEFSYSDIQEKVGGSRQGIIDAIKWLQKNKFIIVKKRLVNGQAHKNIIGLNSKLFGDFIERNHKPKLSFIKGGINSALPPSHQEVTTPVSQALPRPSSVVDYQTPQNPRPERQPTGLNNSLNNSLKEQEKDFDFLGQERTLPSDQVKKDFPIWFKKTRSSP